MKDLNLQILEDGNSTGLSVRNGGFLAEAASVCLAHHNHPLTVSLNVYGDINDTYKIQRLTLNQNAIDGFNDLEEAAEYGAMGIAVALIHQQTGWTVKRSYKGTGFDYWVGEKSETHPFENLLRLEVSGDLQGTKAEVQNRLRKKMTQTKRSASSNLLACAVIVEFSNPMSITGLK